MDPLKLFGIVLLVAGALALVYGGFSYTEDRHQADIGPLHLAIEEQKQVNVPVWAGVGALVLGGVLLLTGKKS